jgi:hypothetical protein
MIKFLKETNIIDYSNQEIQNLAINLSTDCKSDIEIAKNCFEYVRNNINHSGDYKDNITTGKASDVLKYKTYDEIINNFPDIELDDTNNKRKIESNYEF